MSDDYCEDCTRTLTFNERYYYGRRCEGCERKAHDHVLPRHAEQREDEPGDDGRTRPAQQRDRPRE